MICDGYMGTKESGYQTDEAGTASEFKNTLALKRTSTSYVSGEDLACRPSDSTAAWRSVEIEVDCDGGFKKGGVERKVKVLVVDGGWLYGDEGVCDGGGMEWG